MPYGLEAEQKEIRARCIYCEAPIFEEQLSVCDPCFDNPPGLQPLKRLGRWVIQIIIKGG